ncbi:MAG: succinylglutamate desuccinylase/aspartoacylase family protein [Deltaproteobacteria bacterium]
MMEINGTEIRPGENKPFKIRVGKLHSGTTINIYGNVFNGKNEGKRILLIGGIHGDEINGTEIIRRAVEKKTFEDLHCGTVITIPVLNVFGFINFIRDEPSGKDVNRSFPGSNTGSLASRIAKKLTDFILPHTDIIIDFHTGGDTRFNFPQVRFSKISPESKELARQFNAFFTIEKPFVPKSLRKMAHEMGKSVIVYEAGESKRFDESAIDTGLQGINNVLSYFDMKTIENIIPAHDSVYITQTRWIRARESGIFNILKKSGTRVEEKEVIGIIKDLYGEWSKNIISPKKGYIIGHNNAPVINIGDPLFNLGW